MADDDKRSEGTPPARWWEAMTEMRVDQATFCADTSQRIETLETWKKDQNGDIRRIRDDLTGLRESTQKWLVGVLTTLVISLVMLVFNLIVTLGK